MAVYWNRCPGAGGRISKPSMSCSTIANHRLISDRAVDQNNGTVSNVTANSFDWNNVTVSNVTTHKPKSSKHEFSYDDITIKNVTLLRPRKASSNLKKCLKGLDAPGVYPGDKEWNTLSQVYNARWTYTPDVIVLPREEDHVVSAVKCAKITKTKVQAKGGGHSYGSFSTGGKDGSMVIDLRRMNKITYYRTKGGDFVDVEAGTRLGNLALALADRGKAIPQGDCPAVGLAGHALHGGFGYASRMWGLSTDSIVQLNVVTADGKLRETTQFRESGLDWVSRYD